MLFKSAKIKGRSRKGKLVKAKYNTCLAVKKITKSILFPQKKKTLIIQFNVYFGCSKYITHLKGFNVLSQNSKDQ